MTNLPVKNHHRNNSHGGFVFTEQQVLELDEIGKVVTIASTILMVPLVFVNLWRQDRRQYPSRATTMYMLCVLGLHMTVLVGLLDADRTTFLEFYETGLVSKFCLVQGIVYQFFACCTLWLWLLICGILYAVIVKGASFYDLEKLEWYHHATWLGLSTAQTLVPFYMSSAEPQIGVPVCWMSSRNHYFQKFYFFLLEMGIALSIGLIFMCGIIKKLCLLRGQNSNNRATRGNSSGNDVLDYIARHVLFIIFFVVVFAVLTTCTLYEMYFSIDPKRNVLPYFVCVAHVFSACGIGIFTFVVFGTSSANRKIILECTNNCCHSYGNSAYLKENINSRSNHENEFDDLDVNHEVMNSNGYVKGEYGYEKL